MIKFFLLGLFWFSLISVYIEFILLKIHFEESTIYLKVKHLSFVIYKYIQRLILCKTFKKFFFKCLKYLLNYDAKINKTNHNFLHHYKIILFYILYINFKLIQNHIFKKDDSRIQILSKLFFFVRLLYTIKTLTRYY